MSVNKLQFVPVDLTADGQLIEDVVFLASAAPEFCWKNQSPDPDFRQSGYRITATAGNGSLKWDSGIVKSSSCQHVPWTGEPLGEREQVSIQLTVYDQSGNASLPSKPLVCERTLESNASWGNACWIWNDHLPYTSAGPLPCFRKEFEVSKPLAKARLHITARGIFEAFCDGKKIGRDHLAPGWVDFRKHVPFLTYDLTETLAPGKHVLGSIIADGWCCGNLVIHRMRNFFHAHPEFLARLELYYTDGTVDAVVTDSSWETTAAGPYLSADLYDGEQYDARIDLGAWGMPGYSDKRWYSAADAGKVQCDPVPLVQKTAPPVRKIMEIKPVQRLNPKQDIYIWDFGQNFVGTFRVKLRGYPGMLYTFRMAEMLDESGDLYNINYRNARSEDSYICRGEPDTFEEYSPVFTFHGLRYLEIRGFQYNSIPADEIEVTGIVLHSDMELCSSFECGNPLITKLWQNTVWGNRGNYLDLPTDCPQRDERLGWTGDAQVFAPAAMYNMDCRAFLRKFMRDIREGMTPDGAAPSIAPAILRIFDGAAGWGDALIIIPYALYKHYHWEGILRENYADMKRAVLWQKQHSDDLVRAEQNFGDWLAPEDTPVPLVGTAYFARCAKLLSEIAGILHETEDEAFFKQLGNDITATFRAKFVGRDGIVAPATQAALCFALAFGLLEEKDIEKNRAALQENIRNNGNKLSTGFLGTSLIMDVLLDAGLSRCACDLLLQEECPSWLYSVKQGATTIWERWNSFSLESGFGNVSMNSFNHYAYGIVSKFLMNAIAGIRYQANELQLEIIPDPRFSPVNASYDSPCGMIRSSWEIKDNTLAWQVEVPTGLPTAITLPDGSTQKLSAGKHQFKVSL